MRITEVIPYHGSAYLTPQPGAPIHTPTHTLRQNRMHGVRRVKTSAEQQQARQRREAVEIKKFRSLNDKVLQRSSDVPLSTALADSADLLDMDSDLYTVYNIRRELISGASPQDQEILLQKELKLTETLFPRNPKSYWIWNHRRWVLERLDMQSSWDREMALVEKLLEKDPRNFHGWGYRHWLVQREADASKSPKAYGDMFDFTTQKINKNFSNFSAWHYRAQMIPLLEDKPTTLKQELDLVSTAVGMDPSDQSSWIYFQWLVSSPEVFGAEVSEQDLDEIYELVEDLWVSENSLWAGRFLVDLKKRMNKPVDVEFVNSMKEKDPMRAQRYDSLMSS